MVSLGLRCDEEDEYPSIINSDAGVALVTLVCGGEFESEYYFFINPFSRIDNIVKEAINMGFAVAVAGGEFKVTRFSLAGSSYAIEVMRAGAQALMDENGGKQYRQYTDEEYL